MEMIQAAGFIAWHYTTTTRFMRMLKDRALVPGMTLGSSDAPATARPVVWFSVNDDFEPSACRNDPAGRGDGMVRLGVPVRRLLTCTEVRRRAGMPPDVWHVLCEEARAIGSDPDQWFGCMHRIALVDCIVEVRDEDGQWRRMQSAPVAHGAGSNHHAGR